MYSDSIRWRRLPVLIMQVLIMNLLSSCTVLEDRKLCPCTLVVKVSEAPPGFEASDSVSVCVIGESDFTWCIKLPSTSLPCTVSVGVPKGSAMVTAVLPAESATDSGDVPIAFGDGCPQVWLDGELVDTDRNKAVSKLSLHKNWCEISISLVSSASLASQAYTLAMTGNIAGYGPGAEPIQGPFRAPCTLADDGVCRVRVPRQLDNSLRLEVNVPSQLSMQEPSLSMDMQDVSVLRVFAIGEYIAESGYDWSLPDLEDVELTLDLASSRLILRRHLWEDSVSFELVI